MKALQSEAPAPANPEASQPVAPLSAHAADIPEHVWIMLQQAGEKAAERLLDILRAPSFPKLAPSSQARLIELAFVRAYGLPVRRSVEINLSTSDADAVAASLAALADSLPERAAAARARDVTPEPEDV